MTGRL